MPNATYEIRSQQDIDRLYDDVREQFGEIRWESWMQAELRGMEQEHAGYWQRQAGPDGATWPANSPATIRRKGHGIVLVDKLRLKPAMTMPYSSHGIRITVDEWPRASMIFGNDLFYSPLHNDGLGRNKKRQHIGLTMPYFFGMAERAVNHAFEAIQA